MNLDAISRMLHQRDPLASPPSVPSLAPLAPPAAPHQADRWHGEAGAIRLAPLQALIHPSPTPIHQLDPGVTTATRQALDSFPGSVWAGRLASNGQREAAILIPPGFDSSRPAEVVFYFHGHNNTIKGVLTDGGLAGQIDALAQKRNTIVVIPQGPPKERDATWMNPASKESLADFQQAVFARIQALAPGTRVAEVTLKGHSAGGLPLLNGATAGGIRADRVDFLDASYGYWASETHRQLAKHGLHPPMTVIYRPGTSTETDALRLKGLKDVRLQADGTAHGLIPKQHFAD